MQSDPYPIDPNYRPPIEGAPPATPYQPGPSSYLNQPAAPYAVPPNQYVAPPVQAMPSATQRKKQARKYGVAKAMDYLQWVLFALETLFLLRFCLKLLGADPTNPFAQSLFNLTGFFLYPFEGIEPNTPVGTQGVAIIEWSTLVGMAVYALLFYIVRLLLHITISRPEEPVA